MAKNKTYIGNRQSVGRPTLTKEQYMQLIKTIRKGREFVASAKKSDIEKCSVLADDETA